MENFMESPLYHDVLMYWGLLCFLGSFLLISSFAYKCHNSVAPVFTIGFVLLCSTFTNVMGFYYVYQHPDYSMIFNQYLLSCALVVFGFGIGSILGVAVRFCKAENAQAIQS